MKKFLSVILIITLLISIVACSNDKADDNNKQNENSNNNASDSNNNAAAAIGNVTIAQPADPPTLDAQKTGGTYGANIMMNIYETLVFFDKDGEVIPVLATSWETTDEGKTWRFHLRENVTFHNGEAFNADAVAYTIERMMRPDVPRAKYSLTDIASCNVIDNYTVDIVLNNVDPVFPNKTSDLMIIPPKHCEEVKEEGLTKNPVGTGPYKFKEWVPEQRVVIEAYESHWDEKVNVKQLTFVPIPEASTRLAELISGNVDIVIDLNPEYLDMLENTKGVRSELVYGKRVPVIGINTLEYANDALKDVRVRQALNYAVDKEAIINSILGGTSRQVANLFRPDFESYDDTIKPYEYNPEKAKQLLTDAGYAEGLELTLQTSSGAILQGLEIGQAIEGYLKEVGIAINFETYEYNAYRSILIGGQEQQKTGDLFVWNWGAKPKDNNAPLNGLIHSAGVTSYHKDLLFDELFTKAKSAPADSEERDKLWKDVQKHLQDQAFGIYLYQQGDIYGVTDKISWTPRLDQYTLGKDISGSN